MRIFNAVIVTLLAFASSAVAFGDAPKIGVFNPETPGGRGKSCEQVLKTLGMIESFDVTFTRDLTLENLERFDVVVFSCTQQVGTQPDDWRENLRLFAQTGGGLVLTHDSCGFAHALSPSLFPEVETTLGRSTTNTITPTAEGRAQLGVSNQSFKTSWTRYVTMRKGPDGIVFATDAANAAVVVGGDVDMGKLVAIGFLAGYSDKAKNENAFLEACVRWVMKKGEHAKINDERQTLLKSLRKEVILLKKRVEKLENENQESIRELYNEIQYLKNGGK